MAKHQQPVPTVLKVGDVLRDQGHRGPTFRIDRINPHGTVTVTYPYTKDHGTVKVAYIRERCALIRRA
jgi:hypothetical protein